MATASGRRDAVLLLSLGAAGGAALALLAGQFLDRRRRRRLLRGSSRRPSAGDARAACPPPSSLPAFAKDLECDPRLHRIRLREWEDAEWRASRGWKGRDLCHDPDGDAVRVLGYYYYDDRISASSGGDEAGNNGEGVGSTDKTRAGGHQLVGAVWFGPRAESHRGLCHGGAMSSLMDDFAGHCAFVTSDSPWSGATVQVNVALKRPVSIGSVLRIAGRVRERKGRKVFVEAVLDDGGGVEGEEPIVYATLEGLSIDGVKMSENEDAISTRTWEVEVCDRGKLHRRDSGWKIALT